MNIDLATLGLAGGLISAAGSFFLLLHWWQDRQAWPAFTWGLADLALGAGIFLLAIHAVLSPYAATIVAPFFFSNATVATWASARAFNRGSFAWAPALTILCAETALLTVVGGTGHDALAAVLGMGVSAILFAAAGYEFWRGRAERLRGRWPMFGVLLLQSASVSLAAFGSWTANPFLGETSLTVLGSIHLVQFIYVLGSALSLVTMLKDRSENEHRAAALTDSLTGLANRRAFMDRARKMFEQASRDSAPISLLAFDLDRFKNINDTFGHPAGDRVLQIFADVVSRALGTSDLVGRLGGEEFAVLLAGRDTDEALALAHRIRVAFRNDAQFVDGAPIEATVSVGVATLPRHGSSLAAVIASADRALYRAKCQGRDCVVIASRDLPNSEARKVARIAVRR